MRNVAENIITFLINLSELLDGDTFSISEGNLPEGITLNSNGIFVGKVMGNEKGTVRFKITKDGNDTYSRLYNW